MDVARSVYVPSTLGDITSKREASHTIRRERTQIGQKIGAFDYLSMGLIEARASPGSA